MKFAPSVISAALTLALAMPAQAQAPAEAKAPAAAKAPQGPRTLVVVNGAPINELHIILANPQLSMNELNDPRIQQSVMGDLVATFLLSQDAEKRKLDKRRDIATATEMARRKVLSQAAIQEHLKANPIKDDDVKAAYDARFGKGPIKQYNGRHISVKTEDEAKQVIKELDGGASFADLAKKKSVSPTAEKGGDVGWMTGEQLGKPIVEVVAKLEKGKYNKTPIQAGETWHVFLLDDTRDFKPTFDEAKAGIRASLQQQAITKYVVSLQKSAKIGQPGPAQAGGEPQAAPQAKAQAPAKKSLSAEEKIAPAPKKETKPAR
jgi:peptidyl-prolyl cis-trans isomerase C